jgi:hypothetical protein
MMEPAQCSVGERRVSGEFVYLIRINAKKKRGGSLI